MMFTITLTHCQSLLADNVLATSDRVRPVVSQSWPLSVCLFIVKLQWPYEFPYYFYFSALTRFLAANSLRPFCSLTCALPFSHSSLFFVCNTRQQGLYLLITDLSLIDLPLTWEKLTDVRHQYQIHHLVSLFLVVLFLFFLSHSFPMPAFSFSRKCCSISSNIYVCRTHLRRCSSFWP